MTLRQYLQLVYKRRYWLVAGLLVGLAMGAYAVAKSEKSYRGNVTFFVNSVGEGTVASANVGDQFAQRRVNSYLALLRTDRLAEMVVEESGLSASPSAVRSSISGSADLNTVLLTARVASADREQALEIAESLARAFPELVSVVERPVGGEPSVRLEVVSGPSVGVVSVRTNMLLVTRIAMGLLAGLALAVVRELTDNRLHSIDRALALSSAPLLGLVTNDRRAGRSPLIVGDGLGSVRAEEYRQIRTNLQYVRAEARSKVIVVTSSIPSEGKSVTAANLAIAIARSGLRVVIVDADLRKPMVGKLFGVEQAVGLVEVLQGRAALDDVLQPWSPDLAVLPAGAQTSVPSELLGSVATRRLIDDLRAGFDTVIIDSPPLVPVTDAAIVSTMADGVVLLVRPDKVTKAQFQRSLNSLERVSAKLLGIVGSMVPERSNPYVGYVYGGSTSPADAETASDDADELSQDRSPRAIAGNLNGGELLQDALRQLRDSRRGRRRS